MKNILQVFLFFLCVSIIAGTSYAQTWKLGRNGKIIQISYGSGTDFPQYAALDSGSGYFRLIYGPTSGWGTSVVLLPSFWHNGTLFQGAPVTASWDTESTVLIISISGSISNLQIQGQVRLSPPGVDSISAAVSVNVTGTETLDTRPGEAFKPVMLSSMRISADSFDCALAYVDSKFFAIPLGGWIIHPPEKGMIFGLMGATSRWKTNAPTVEIDMDQSDSVTGWVSNSHDPNDDNVGFWTGSDTIVHSWHYTIVAKKSLYDTALAVEATSFHAVASSSSIVITWRTESELKNLGFNIFRRDFGSESSSLIASYNSSPTLRGLGTSSTGKNYLWTDKHVLAGHTYEYTVESVASDGTKKDYPAIAVKLDVPKTFALYQNFPNPFNPATTISYDIPEASHVRLAIFDMLGRKMALLVDENKDAGSHKTVFGASRLSSGVYFYRLEAGPYHDTKKLLLLK